MIEMRSLLRHSYDAANLNRLFPPQLTSANKQLVLELCGPQTTGTIEVSRWAAKPLPADVPPVAPRIELIAGHFDYAGPSDGVWHLNFADPDLFFAYGSRLLAQDELQCAEHPALGLVREALIAANEPALTADESGPTPVLVMGVERRCAIDTLPAPERPSGLYGNHFASASSAAVRGAVRVHRPASLSNIIAIAAPSGGSGTYTADQIHNILSTAYTGFAAAVAETARRWPGAPTEIRTGFWGCGAFGGNRELMTMLQLLAARLAGVTCVKFYAFDDKGRADFTAGAKVLDQILTSILVDEDPPRDIETILELVDAHGYFWGQGNGT